MGTNATVKGLRNACFSLDTAQQAKFFSTRQLNPVFRAVKKD